MHIAIESPTQAASDADAIRAIHRLGLTLRQAQIYHYLFTSTMRNGYQPSIRDLMEQFHITSPNGVCCHLRRLEDKGWIDVGGSQGLSRAVRFALNPDGSPFRGFVIAPAE